MEDRLILVDYKDNIVGEAYKQEVHEKGLLHRAFSVFIINGNKMLIQKRAKDKYHSAGLWANTCCSHPRVNEDTYDAAIRRLKEECGIECEIKEITLSEEKYRSIINSLNKVHIISKEDLAEDYDIDKSRYIVTVSKEYSGHKLLEYLREQGIQCEMSFASGVVLLLSPINDDDDFKKLLKSFENLQLKDIRQDNYSKYYSFIPKKVLEPYEVFKKECKYIKINEADKNIACEAIIPYPPGIPLLCPGEVITKEAIDIIDDYISNNRSVIGIKNKEYIKVVIE